MCLNKLHNNKFSRGIQGPEMVVPKVSSLDDFTSIMVFNICSQLNDIRMLCHLFETCRDVS